MRQHVAPVSSEAPRGLHADAAAMSVTRTIAPQRARKRRVTRPDAKKKTKAYSKRRVELVLKHLAVRRLCDDQPAAVTLVRGRERLVVRDDRVERRRHADWETRDEVRDEALWL